VSERQPASNQMLSALAVYGAALRRASRGQCAALRLVDGGGTAVRHLDACAWYAELRPGDHGLLDRCRAGSSTLDIGCGPGRFTGALVAEGRVALGVDVSPQAVRYARQRGAPAVRADVFAAVPDAGRWCRALLADGNIGIGGDPVRLLRRCRVLLGADGGVLVEVDPPGTRFWEGRLALTDGARVSTPFGWAFVGVDDIAALARRALLRVGEIWTEAGRWFVYLSR
jgi:SAM-dependent methyltransferase